MRLVSLERDDRLWRVDGVSSVIIRGIDSTPKAKFLLSQIKEDCYRKPLGKNASTGEQIEIIEPLNKIDDLLIGSLWRFGKKFNPIKEVKYTYEVDTSDVVFFDPLQALNIDGFGRIDKPLNSNIINYGDKYWFFRSNKYAYLPVKNPKGIHFLIIPCTELYRFYYGVSDRLLNSIIKGDIDRYSEWSSDGYMYVKKRLTESERFVLFRGLRSKRGNEWLYTPSKHIKSMKANSNGEEVFYPIYSIFPFEGVAKLSVVGKRVCYEINGKQLWGVFVANIRQCSGDEGFREILTEVDVYSKEPPKPGKPPKGGKPPKNGGSGDEDPPEEPPPPGGGRDVDAQMVNRFRMLNEIEFPSARIKGSLNPIFENKFGKPRSSSDKNGGQGDGTGSGGIEVEKYKFHTDPVDGRLSQFIDMLLFLRLVAPEGWSLRTLTANGSSILYKGETITGFSGSRRPTSWRCVGEGRSLGMRQVVWVELTLPSGIIYLAEMQLKDSEAGRSTLCIIPKRGDEMSEFDFQRLLYLTARRNSWPKFNHKWERGKDKERADEYFRDYDHAFIGHPRSSFVLSKQRWVALIKGRLEELIG